MLHYALLSLLVLSTPPAESWSTCSNARYGYSISIPPGLTGQGESANGDGQEFQDASGKVSLKVWGALVVELEGEPESSTTLASARRVTLKRWREQGVRITYQPQSKGWWVLSGEDREGQVRYLKYLEKASPNGWRLHRVSWDRERLPAASTTPASSPTTPLKATSDEVPWCARGAGPPR